MMKHCYPCLTKTVGKNVVTENVKLMIFSLSFVFKFYKILFVYFTGFGITHWSNSRVFKGQIYRQIFRYQA